MIDVALTRAELRSADLVVVIDVLRATSTITQALAAGYERVLCADSVERAWMLRAEGRVLAGERHCVRPGGFDQGNSPVDAMTCEGRELVLATTNGAPTIVAAARCASRVLLACLLNLDAVLQMLSETPVSELDLQVVCSGTDETPALEDTYLAGLLCAALPGPRTDTARIAEAVSRGYRTPFEALDSSTDADVLRAAGLAGDITYCALRSKLQAVPRVLGATGGVATVIHGTTVAAGVPESGRVSDAIRRASDSKASPGTEARSGSSLRPSRVARESDEHLDRRPHGSNGRAQHEPRSLRRPVP